LERIRSFWSWKMGDESWSESFCGAPSWMH